MIVHDTQSLRGRRPWQSPAEMRLLRFARNDIDVEGLNT
jgi:hypothetical protein